MEKKAYQKKIEREHEGEYAMKSQKKREEEIETAAERGSAIDVKRWRSG